MLTSAVAVAAPLAALLWWESELLLVDALVLGPVLVVSAGSWGSGIADVGVAALFVASVVFLFARFWSFGYGEATASDFFLVLSAWVVMPAIVRLFVAEDRTDD